MYEGKLVRLRAYTKEDIPQALKYLNSYEVTKNLSPGIPYPFTLEDEEKWYASNSALNDTYSFAIETLEDNLYLGGCGINQVDFKNSHVMIGIFIGDPAYWGKGYGTDALKLLTKFIFEEMNIHKIKLGVYSFNERAIKCYEKVGFIEEGILKKEIFKEGKYYDEHLMALFRN